MNLFVLACAAPTDQRGRIGAVIRDAGSLYPQLDPQTFREHRIADDICLAYIHHGEEHAAPRRYVDESGDGITLYDGLPLATCGGFRAHRAEELAARWDSLPETLEGRFCAIQARRNGTVSLLLGPLGLHSVFAAEREGAWYVSNSVYLLSRLLGEKDLDETAAAAAVGLGWIPGRRTLIENIHALEGGRLWEWSRLRSGVEQWPYFRIADLALRRRPVEELAEELRVELGGLLTNQFESFPDTTCPIAGGRDARLVLALVKDAELEPRCYSIGSSSEPDAAIGAEVAEVLSLQHGFKSISENDVCGAWSWISKRLIEQTDGLVSLWQARDVLAQRQRWSKVATTLGGIGGDIARRVYAWPELQREKLTPARAVKQLARLLLGETRDFLTSDAFRSLRRELETILRGYADMGVPAADIPDAFYAFERIRRWGGGSVRKMAPVTDTILPLATRSFVRAAFAMTPEQRLDGALHDELLRSIHPDLLAIPYDETAGTMPRRRWWSAIRESLSNPRSARRSAAAVATAPLQALTMRERILRRNRYELRQLCLDRRSSALWSLLDRDRFEDATTEGGLVDLEPAALQSLYAIITLFRHEELREG